jgi:methionyl-tRNA formyltransferase
VKENIRILLLCNSEAAIPAIDELIRNYELVGIGILRKTKKVSQQLLFILPRAESILFYLPKENWISILKDHMNRLKPDVVFVITFPYKITPELLTIPRFGFINFHFGSLPKYAGNNPIFWQIKNLEPFATISVHRMDENIDTGPILLKESILISPGDTFGMILVKFSYLLVKLVNDVLEQLSQEKDDLKTYPQEKVVHRYMEDARQEDVTIDWEIMDSASITAMVNAANPWNQGAFTSIRGLRFNILQVSQMTGFPSEKPLSAEPGTIMALNDKVGLLVKCNDKKILRIDIILTEMGFTTGKHLATLGIQCGEQLGN